MKLGRAGTLRTAALSTAVVIVALTVGILLKPAQSKSASGPQLQPGAPAPTPATHTVPSSQQLHYVSGPFVSKSTAESTALAIDAGGATGLVPTVFEAKLESVKAASVELGSRVAIMSVGSDRIVWVIGIHGTYQPPACPPQGGTCPQPAMPNQDYYVVIDAATGHTLSSGIFNAPITGLKN